MEKLNFSHPEYLPNSQERLEHLRHIISGRPVAILAAGPSLAKLEEKVVELSRADICYFGMNNFFVQEDHILKKINKRFSVLIEGGDDKEILPIIDKINTFLDRNDDNVLISSLPNLQRFLDRYQNKLLCPGNGWADRTAPNNNHPLHFINGNSLSWLIYLAVIGKASKIVLFGADGHTQNKDIKDTYYRSEEYGTEPQKQLMENTNKGFNPVVPISLRNIYKTHSIESVPILNCSEVSFYTPFPKISYDDAFAFLLGSKNAEEVSDLRIPTASILIPHSGNETELQKTLKNISEQSYSNYETIVVQEGLNFLDIMKNALSLAKGKYVFNCPAGDSYQDRDWINSCLEVLENRPQISLVCGLSEDQFTDSPWRKKMFVYYWLKKKIFFPPNALCVRKKVLEKCLFHADNTQNSNTAEFESWLNFNLQFNMAGYLPAFIPTIADYHQQYKNKDSKALNEYKHKTNNYKFKLIFRKVSHRFRDGEGNFLPGKFYLSVFLLYGIAKKIKDKLPRPLRSCLNIIRQIARKIYQK